MRLRLGLLNQDLAWLPQKSGHSKCRIIIDCTEIFIERPKSLINQASTWSDYKHHNTVKFL